MKFYLYDEKTKQFLKEQDGYLDPLESKAQGKNVYIVPPFSTAEKPNLSELKDNEIFVFKDNKWQVEQEFYVGKIVDCQSERVSKYVNDNNLTFEKCDDGFKIVEKPVPKEKTLEEAKSGKLKELSELTDKIFNSPETYLTSSLGFRINARSKALEDINSLIILGDAITYFNDFDDVIHELGVEQLEILQKEVIKSGQNIYHQKWAYRKQIENAKSVEILQKIEFEFEFSDFKDGQQA